MKKIFSFIIALALIAVSAFAVFAADSYSVSITGDNVSSLGSSVTLTFAVKDIVPEGGFSGGTIKISYDKNVLTYDSFSASLSGWEMPCTAGDGVLTLNPVELIDGTTPITDNNKIVYKITFKVSSTTDAKSTSVEVTSASMTDTLYEQHKLSSKPTFTIKIKQKLDTPTNVVFNGTVASWDAVTNASSYLVQLYKDNAEYGSSISSSGNSIDLSSKMKDGGEYTFTVVAVASSEEYANSDESSKCNGSYLKTGKLATPKITLEKDIENGGLKYQITDTNSADLVSFYEIKVFSGSTEIHSLNSSSKAGNIALNDNIVAGASYSVSVIAKSADTTKNADSSSSKQTTAVKASEKPVSISFDVLPSLVYKEGDKLSLSSMVVVINYESGKTVKVKYSDFSKYGLTCNFTSGVKMALTDSGNKFVVKLGVLSTSTSAITVNSGDCKHTNTSVVRVEPTCGQDGYENTVCNDCKAIVSSKTIASSGEHQYDEWVIVVNPTTALKGMKQRVCSVCGHIESEEIAPVTTEPKDSTTPKTTTEPKSTTSPAETDYEINDPHTMDDISKIFLTIIIVIFALIVFFLIMGLYLENKRSKARRKRKASARRK